MAIVPLMAGIDNFHKKHIFPKALHKAASILNVLQVAIAVGTTAFVFGSRIINSLSCIKAESTLINRGPRYGSMGTTAIRRSEFSALEFNIKVQIYDLNLVRGGLSGDTILFQSIRDVEGAQSKLNLYDEDIGIAFTSAYFTEKPLSIKKLSALISAKGNINTDFSGYRSAFRDLMSDFSSSHVPTFTLTANPARIQDIFFSELDSAVLINYKKIVMWYPETHQPS